jgi:hypothetical protein
MFSTIGRKGTASSRIGLRYGEGLLGKARGGDARGAIFRKREEG